MKLLAFVVLIISCTITYSQPSEKRIWLRCAASFTPQNTGRPEPWTEVYAIDRDSLKIGAYEEDNRKINDIPSVPSVEAGERLNLNKFSVLEEDVASIYDYSMGKLFIVYKINRTSLRFHILGTMGDFRGMGNGKCIEINALPIGGAKKF